MQYPKVTARHEGASGDRFEAVLGRTKSGNSSAAQFELSRLSANTTLADRMSSIQTDLK